MINSELREKIKKLTFSYLDRPQPELLITVPNPHPDIDYIEKLVYPEFTSLCPLARTQPDYATITILYMPREVICELKSLKFYLTAFRSVEIFHEAVVGQIYKDLSSKCNPKQIKVVGEFTVRGGIQTTVTVGSLTI